MKAVSKTDFSHKYFSTKIYLQMLKHTRVVGIGSLILILFVNILWVVVEGLLRSAYETKVITVTGGEIVPLCAIIFLQSFFLTCDVFWFQFKRDCCDTFHALPQKRICIYLSFLASIFTWILSTILITFLSCSVIWSSFELLKVDWSSLFPMIVGTFLSCAVVSSVSILGSMFAGTIPSYMMYTVVLFAAPRALAIVFAWLVTLFNNTLIIEHTFLKYISNIEYSFWFCLSNTNNNATGLFSNSSFMIFLFIEALLILTLAGIFFVKRKSETATKPYVHKSLHIIFRALTILTILMVTIAIDTISFFVFGIALLVHFIFDVVCLKSAKASLKSLVWFLLPLGLCFVFALTAKITGNAFKLFGPDKSNLASVSIVSTNEDDLVGEAFFSFNEINQNLWTDNEEALDTALKALSENTGRSKYSFEYWEDSIYYDSFILKFKMKSGKEYVRSVFLNEQQLKTILAGIKSEEENKEKVSLPEWTASLNAKIFFYFSSEPISKDIYETFKEEYNSISVEKQAEAEIKYENQYIRFDIGETMYFFFLSRENFPKTTSVIYDSPDHNSAECASKFKEKIKEYTDSQKKGTYLSVVSTTTDENYKIYITSGEMLNRFYNSLVVKNLADTSDANKTYYVKFEDNYYFFALDDNVLSLIKRMAD